MSNDPHPDALRPLALIVGAHAHTFEQLGSALAARGLNVEYTPDGPTALGVVQCRVPAVVLVCLAPNESGMNAIEVCEALRRLDALNQTPVLIGVHSNDERELERAFEAGATDVFDLDACDGFIAGRLSFLLRAGISRQLGERHADSTDGITGLPDGRSFKSLVKRAMNHASVDGTSMAVLCIDVDRFHEIAAGLEVATAEQLLVDVADRLRTGLRETDTLQVPAEVSSVRLARISGGEFSILLEGLERPEDSAKVAQRLIDVVADPFEFDGREVSLSSNVGIAAYPCQIQGAEDLLSWAEAAMYSARQQGRDTLRFYDSEMNSKVFERLTLETNLRRALMRDELVVYYQPRVEITTGRILSFEALVRWQHPELGLVSPAQFIPLAEETGLIVPIGEWVLETACRQNRAWQTQGLPNVSVSVNLSSVQFRKPDLYDTVVRVLGESGLDPSWLELELTESMLMQNAESVVETLKRFRSTGIHLSIDDFGTGYSSLSYLKRFPIDAIKIDRSFISEVTTNSDDAALATSIILMGRSLKLRVVAEGVETESQLSFLRIMQCDEVQGYLYSPPVPAEEATAMLRAGLVRPDVA